mgnify:CR=1 FL=1
MGKIKKHVFVLLLVVTAIVGCDEKPKAVISNKPSFVLVKMPEVNADSVFGFVQQQVDFGPRIQLRP